MTLLILLLGLMPSALGGWLLLRLIEGRTPVLFRSERWAYGCMLGLTGMMFLSFVANTSLGIPLSLAGFGGVQAATLMVLGLLWNARIRPLPAVQPTLQRSPLRGWQRWLVVVLGAWTLVKILGGTFMLTATPIFLDDAIDNWNFRGKVYYVDHTFTLDVLSPEGHSTMFTLNSYPPPVPLAKTWLATIRGEWDEGLINSIHIVWFFGALLMVFFALRRRMSLFLALVGTYALASLPLFLVHGTNPYADLFLAVHLLAAVVPLGLSLDETDTARITSFIRLSGLAAGLLLFTKNEALLLYLPDLLLCLAFAVWLHVRAGRLTERDVVEALVPWFASLLLIGIAWFGFKVLNGMPFGNAKSVESFVISWQPLVASAIAVNTFFEGNWLLLFPALILLLLWQFRAAVSSRNIVFVGFFVIALAVQYLLFQFTSLSNEALYQTGLARGILQVVPVGVVVGMLMLKEAIE